MTTKVVTVIHFRLLVFFLLGLISKIDRFKNLFTSFSQDYLPINPKFVGKRQKPCYLKTKKSNTFWHSISFVFLFYGCFPFAILSNLFLCLQIFSRLMPNHRPLYIGHDCLYTPSPWACYSYSSSYSY